MTGRIFTLQDAWTGGTYDLALELGPRDDARLGSALRALWTHADLDGCYQHADLEPNEQPRIEVSTSETRLYGVARIGTEGTVASYTVVMRFDDGIDWIHFCLPMGSLGRIFDVGAFPFEDDSDLAWRLELDEWLCALGRRVFEAAPFRLALIGWDGGELGDAARFADSGVPAQRSVGYLVPSGGRVTWFAPNANAPLTFTGPEHER